MKQGVHEKVNTAKDAILNHLSVETPTPSAEEYAETVVAPIGEGISAVLSELERQDGEAVSIRNEHTRIANEIDALKGKASEAGKHTGRLDALDEAVAALRGAINDSNDHVAGILGKLVARVEALEGKTNTVTEGE